MSNRWVLHVHVYQAFHNISYYLKNLTLWDTLKSHIWLLLDEVEQIAT